MIPFWQALVLVFLAELGDKTQLAALAMATRFSPKTVLAGVCGGALLVQLLSAAVGEIIGLVLPTLWVAILAGLAFLGFAGWTLRSDYGPKATRATPSGLGAFGSVAVTFFVAELGDKTMLATVALASEYRALVPVWLGGTLGLVVADGIAIFIGKAAADRLPERPIRYFAAAVFALSGLIALGGAFFSR